MIRLYLKIPEKFVLHIIIIIIIIIIIAVVIIIIITLLHSLNFHMEI